MNTEELEPILEEIAPSSLAESWDRPGWQVRCPDPAVTGILVAMDVAPAVLDEAEKLGCNLILTHHPLMFKPLQTLDLSTPRGRLIARLIRGEVSVWAAHTNLDVLPEGTSMALARALGLRHPSILSRVQRQEYKLSVFVPVEKAEDLKNALAEAGAGRIGDYTHCFWQVIGTGQFKPGRGTDPYLGSVGELEKVEEVKVEGVVSQARLGPVLEAMRRTHPYEEVAYDLVPLANQPSTYGFGAVGQLPSPMSTSQVAVHAGSVLASPVCQLAGDPERVHQRVAVMGGSGASFYRDALRAGATLFITADVKYHEAQDAVDQGLDLVVLDHFATERPVLDLVAERLRRLVSGIPVSVATAPTSPFKAGGS